ncbi:MULTISPECIES: hypothetical protein [Flavobacterium]|uniref:Uncharacterized protein n=2 Tax=Flavobacterium TaxID=237 RepID=A0ABW8PSE8_9FLAO|nr:MULTISPECIES: hypothetical protein [Flavobacterium]QYS89284.1 hypothetical protein JJC05_02595 [Flavobacterium davisii]SPE78137.1 hypothetical protein FLACOL_02152 [Flavobacterium columnare]
MRRKIIKGIIISLVVIGLCFILNPFYWLMDSSAIKQPELSIEEENYFEKFENESKISIERYYENFDSKGNDTLYINDFDKRVFDYTLALHMSNNKGLFHLEEDSVFNIANHIKKEVLKNNKYLRYIYIYDDLNKYKFINKYKYLEKAE